MVQERRKQYQSKIDHSYDYIIKSSQDVSIPYILFEEIGKCDIFIDNHYVTDVHCELHSYKPRGEMFVIEVTVLIYKEVELLNVFLRKLGYNVSVDYQVGFSKKKIRITKFKYLT